MPTWDDVIDETARRLTDGQPRRGFTTRVVARLDERPRRWSRAWLIAPAASAAIVVVLAVIMPRERPGDAASNLKVETVRTDVRLKPDATEISEADVTNASGDDGTKADTKARLNDGARTPDTTAVRAPSAAINTDLTLAALEMPPLTTAGTEVHALPDLAPLENDDPLTIAPIDASSGQ